MPVTFDLEALDRVAAANRAVPDVLRARMTDAGRSIIVPAWNDELRKRGRNMQKRLIIPGSYATAGFGGFTLVAGVSRETLSGGGSASELARPFEFGTSRPTKATYGRTSRNGHRHTVTRVTTAQIPRRASKGWVAYPAGSSMIKRAVNLWVEIVVKVLADAAEGKTR